MLILTLILTAIIAFPSINAIAGDGTWDRDKGGTDRDLDNDGVWDYDKGGIDRDLDNDGVWDFDKGGIDRDIDKPF